MSRKKWTNEKLIFRLLNNKSDSTYWDNIGVLRSRPSNEVYTKAIELANSEIEKEKIIGIDILAQLGHTPRPYIEEIIKLYFELIENEQSPDILMSLLYAIGHNNENLNLKQVSKLIENKSDKNVKVRQALVFALLSVKSKKAIDTLIELMNDKVSSIRNWATFGIGSQIETNNAKIIDALWKRIDDRHNETKLEAIVGLAIRGDSRINAIIKRELRGGDYGLLLFEAIEAIEVKNDNEIITLLESDLNTYISNDSISPIWLNGLKKCIKILKQ